MKEYAVINSNIVSNVIAIEDGSNYPIIDNMIDITNLIPQPEIGDSYSEGIFTPQVIPIPTTAQYAIQAKTDAQAYIASFYETIEIVHILLLLLQGTMEQKIKAEAIQLWIQQVINEAVTHSSNPNFQQFTPPPYTYLDIVGLT